VRGQLEREAYDVSMKIRAKPPVQRVLVSFPGRLHELRLSPHRAQSLSIRIEVDTNPPSGAGLETS
jgi:hypothetical protein